MKRLRLPRLRLPALPRVNIPPDLLAFTLGLLVFCAGLYMVYPPAAFIGCGLVVMAVVAFGHLIP